MNGDWLSGLLTLNLAAAWSALLVAALRTPFRRRFGITHALGLWLAVPAAMIATLIPARSVVVWVSAHDALAAAPAVGTVTATSVRGDEETVILMMMIWCVGMLAMLGVLLVRQHRFRRNLGSLVRWRGRVLRAESSLAGPVVLRPWRPMIVIPADFTRRFDRTTRRWVMAHERSHLQRGDLWIQIACSMVRVFCWFNPIVHWADALLRRDLELSADAEVIRRFPLSRKRYAETLLNVQLAVPGLPVGCLWQSSHPLKERILMLKTHPPRPTHRAISALLVTAVAVAVGGASWAGQPGQTELRVAESATHRAQLVLRYGDETKRPELHFRDEAAISAEMGEGHRRVTLELQIKLEGDSFKLKSVVLKDDRPIASYRFEFEQNTHFNQVVTVDGQTPSLTIEGVIEPLSSESAKAGRGTMNAQADSASRPDHAAAVLAPLAAHQGRWEPMAGQPDEDPRTLVSPAPEYPPEALASGAEGKVVVRIVVQTDGSVAESHVHDSSGDAALDRAARDSVVLWKFDPARRGGVAVPAEVLVPVCFSRSEHEDSPCEASPRAASAEVI